MSGPVPTLLQRETFELSRAMEFFSDRELTAQIGHNRYYWPVALLKELLDNALDACETANLAPVIRVELQDDALIVADNGPGLPLATLERSLDYSIRVSDKTGYVSPSRGQQGNALKTVWAAAFVATGNGLIEVETAVYRRVVEVTLDRIAQVPKLELIDAGTPNVKTGTRIVLRWRGIASCLTDLNPPDFYSVVFALTDFNPHCTLTATAPGLNKTFPATDPDWQHWRPDRPTAPHWYTPERFRQGIARLARGGKIKKEPYQDAYRNKRERYALVRVSSTTNAQPTHNKRPYACVSSHRGVGINSRTTNATDELTHPPAPVEADPYAARVAELVALGWSLPNARARALDEARDPRMAGEARS